MSLNERQRRLATILVESTERMTIHTLAERLRVSPRTVRYDLDSLESWLKQRNVNLIRRPQKGVWLEAAPGSLAALQHELGPIVSYDCSLSPEERQQLLTALLLQSEKPLTTEELANRLMISRATVVADLQKVRTWFAKRGITLQSKPNVGYYQESSEKDWRRAVSDLLAESAGEKHLIRYLTEMSSGSGPWRKEGADGGIALALSLFHEVDLTGLEKIVAKVCERRELVLNDSSLIGLVVHLALAITRLKQGKDIVMPSSDLEAIEENTEFSIAREVAWAVREEYKVEMPPAEIGYITLHLMGAKLRSFRKDVYEGHDNKADTIKPLAMQFIRRAETLLGVELVTDTQLFDGLTIHLLPTQARVKFGLPFRNPLMDEIKQKFSFLFFVAKQAARVLEHAWGNNLPDEEIGYLTLHLGAAVERLKTKYRTAPKALVVCGSGVGTSQLLASILRSEIPEIKIVGFGSAFGIAQQIESLKPDLVLSTVPLKNCGVQTIVLSSIPTSQEIQELRVALGLGSSRARMKQEDGLEGKHGFSGGKKPVLSDVLVAETVALDAEAKDWEEGVRLAGRLLVRTGSIEERYVESMIRAVRELGPYIVIAPGIAMPHARPEDGARKIGLSLVRLKSPVPFGNPTNDPVDLIIGLSAVDSDSHLKLLAQLSRLINDRDRLQAIREARSKEGILALVSQVSEEN